MLVLIFFADESDLVYQRHLGFLADERLQAVFQDFRDSLLHEVPDRLAVFVGVQQHRQIVDFGFHEFQCDLILSVRYGGHHHGLHVASDERRSALVHVAGVVFQSPFVDSLEIEPGETEKQFGLSLIVHGVVGHLLNIGGGPQVAQQNVVNCSLYNNYCRKINI